VFIFLMVGGERFWRGGGWWRVFWRYSLFGTNESLFYVRLGRRSL